MPLLGLVERLLDRRQDLQQSLRDSGLERLWLQNVCEVVLLDLLNRSVNKRLSIATGNSELRLAGVLLVLQCGSGQQHVLDEADDAVAVDLLGRAEGLLQLLAHNLGRVEQVDLRVRVRRAHLAALLQARDQRVHQVRALAVADARQTFDRESEDFALVDAAELGVDAQVLFVERLHYGVDLRGEGRGFDLLDDFGAGFGGIVAGDCG